jgi:hypothetical protein
MSRQTDMTSARAARTASFLAFLRHCFVTSPPHLGYFERSSMDPPGVGSPGEPAGTTQGADSSFKETLRNLIVITTIAMLELSVGHSAPADWAINATRD